MQRFFEQQYIYRTGIGQDSHRFLPENSNKPCIIGGLVFPNIQGLCADSDGDPVFHALCNAITSITNIPILGGIAKTLCHEKNITDSRVYLEKALESLGEKQLVHIAISIEAQKPRMQSSLEKIQKNIATVTKLPVANIGITVTSGDYLTDFGCGKGIQCLCIITVREKYR